jgi:1-acyl-sn-glycerol-3-phosphate acyltransferase
MLGFLRLAAMTLATFALAVPAILLSAFDRGGARSSAVVALWARTILRLAGVRLRVEGRENLPPEGAQLFVSSHQSMLDVPALFCVVPPRTRFIAKRELFRIPLFGQAIRMLGFVPIDRGDVRAAVRSLHEAGELARSRRPVLVFPEGTRGDGTALLPFKRGAFALAADLQLPVVPVACLGGARRLPSGAWRVTPGEMLVRIAPALAPGGPAHLSRATLMTAVRAEIERLVAEA